MRPYPVRVRGDGDGWVFSDGGGRYWGRHGAAGLLLRAPRSDGSAAVLLQHRAPWSHQGGTWGLPGGARDSHETPEQAASRYLEEQTGLRAAAAVYLFEDEEDGEACVTMDMEYEVPRFRREREKINPEAKFVGPVNVVVGPQSDYNWKVLVDLLGMDFREVIDEVMSA